MEHNKLEEKDFIEIRGAKAHNLKNVSLDIPRGEFVVITGLSGSGKSSLAFDTIYAEGQRRYMDTLSAYAKHFMGVLEKPEVEEINGLSPIIAIEQKTTGNNPRSTVGTITEIYDFLRLLYARASRAYSPVTGKEMSRYTDEQIVSLIMQKYNQRKCYLLAPLVRGRKGHYKELFDNLRKRGFTQVRIDGELRDLATVTALDRYKAHFIELVVDKMKPATGDDKRVKDSVATALGRGKGSLAVLDLETGEIQHYSKHLVDPDSGISLQEPAPHSFSFNSPEGYCPHCKGLGKIVNVDIDAIIPDRSVSIADGGIIPLGKIRETKKFDIIRSIARRYDFSLYDPIEDIPEEAVSLIVYGSDELFRVGDGTLSEMVAFPGIVDDIEEKIVCPVCHGTRLNEQTNCFRIDGKTISEVAAMEMSTLAEWFAELPSKLTDRENIISRDILKELKERTGFMLDVGLDYLSLDRATASLSGGESQRIRLATQIGSSLMGVLYILDEPSIGLHQRDNCKLLNTLKQLRDLGNTLIVVEHDEETMRAADFIVDIGPGAGVNGGNVVCAGSIDDICACSESVTGQYLSGRKHIPVPAVRRKGNGKSLVVRGACENNLKNIDVEFPLGKIICVTGVSGSGKSSLVNEILYKTLAAEKNRVKVRPGRCAGIDGLEYVDKVIALDQSPIGRSPRSNPATYTGVFNDIRDLFASTQDAKLRGYSQGRFSFNVKGGRCEACSGDGLIKIEMHFLPDVYVPCDVCGGKRYNRETLEVRYKGKNIADVLDMTVEEACSFFASQPKILSKLQTLYDVGLGYVRLGQSSTTLSGGEAQRVKLATELSKRSTGSTVYVLDEPTTGLHIADVHRLIDILDRFADAGNTVVVIEHNLDVIKTADYIIDMGPEGGDGGGTVIAQGTPEEICEVKQSYTGQFLKPYLEKDHK